MSGTILYSLRVNGAIPLTATSYNFYLAGAATSLCAIASISDFIFKRKKKFFPLMVWLFVSMIYQFICLMLSLFKTVEDRNITEMIQGYIDTSTTFYFLILAPIMIAYSNRATQEITPAATIMAINLTVVAILDYILTEVIVGSMVYLDANDSINRIPALLALIIAFIIIRPTAIKEWRQDDASQIDQLKIDEDQYTTSTLMQPGLQSTTSFSST